MWLTRLCLRFLTLSASLSTIKAIEISTICELIIAAAKNNHCSSINLIASRAVDTSKNAQLVSKNLATSFLYSRIITPEEYNKKNNHYHCSFNVLLDATVLFQEQIESLKNEKWLVFSHGNDTAEQVFADVHVPFDSEVSFVTSAHSEYLKVEEVYRVRSDYPLRIRHVDTVNPATLTLHEKSLITEKTLRQNLEGLAFTVGSHNHKPTTYTVPIRNGAKKEVAGYIAGVFQDLASATNFQFNIKWYRLPAGSYQKGTWSGLSGLLDHGEIDVILTAFNMSPERMDLAAFPGTLLRSRFQVYMRPKKSKSTIEALLKPFGRNVWEVLVMWIILCSCCQFLCIYMRKKYKVSKVEIRPMTFIEIFYCTLQSLCQQAISYTPKVASVRIIVLITFLTASLLVQSYSASLISSLTKRAPVKPFSTLSQMVEANYKLVVGKDSADYNLFTTSNDPFIQNIIEKTLLPLNSTLERQVSYEGMFEYMITNGGKLAVLADERHMEYLIKLFPPKILEGGVVKMDRALTDVHQSFAFKKGSPYIDLFRYRTIQMTECGILQRFKKRYWPEEDAVQQNIKGVTMEDISPVFFGLLIGAISSISILLFEIYFHKRNTQNLFHYVD